MLRAPILFVFGAIAFGVALAEVSALSWPWWAAALACGCLLLWRSTAQGRGVAAAALATLVAAAGLSAALNGTPPELQSLCDDDVWRARVTGPAERVVGPTGLARRVEVELVAQRCGQTWMPQRGKLQLRLWDGIAVVRGDVVQLRLAVLPLAAPRNPGDGYAAAARRRGWSGRARTRSHHIIVEHGDGLGALLDRAREAASARLERVLSAEHAAVAKAVSVGDRGAITPEQRELWATAGTAHLLAISGLHVGLIATLLFFLWRTVLGFAPGAAERFSVRRVAALATMPFVVGFCVWVGAPASAVRATVMACAFLLGLALGRPSTAANALGIAGTAMLLLEPTSLYDIGFLLSFAAVTGLLLLPRLPPARSLARRVGRWVVAAGLTSLAATVATLPVMAYAFGRVSVVGPATNVVAVPIGGLLVTPIALVFMLLAPLAGWLEVGLGWLLRQALQLLDAIVGAAAASPFASVDLPRPHVVEIVAYVTFVGCAVWLPRRRAAWIPMAAAAVLLCGSTAWRVNGRWGDGRLTVVHPYVGQGESTLILLPEGGVVLFDAGGAEPPSDWDPGRTILAPELRRRGIHTVNLAIISHPHPDHSGGFSYLAKHFRIGELWTNGMGHENVEIAEVIRRVTESGGTVSIAAELPARQERQGVSFEILHPRPTNGGHFPGLNLNDNSTVLRLKFGERSILLPGDIGVSAEAMLDRVLVPTDVLKSPHHGSVTSSSEALLDALRPSLAIISVGENNGFGLPDQEILSRYREHDIEVLRTDEDGMVQMSTDGEQWEVVSYRGRTLDVP